MENGSVFKRCGCRDQVSGRLLGARCPRLGSPRHGSWYFTVHLASAAGQRRRVRRGGYRSRQAAAAALAGLSGPRGGPEPGLATEVWLDRWLASRLSLRASTYRSYAAHVRGYLVPHVGAVPVAELTAADVQRMLRMIIRGHEAARRPVSAATLRRIHATLRAALNAAVRAGLIDSNPARRAELPPAARPRPQVWTAALVQRWEHGGGRPVVAVWTAEQTAAFLRCVRGHRLYALFHLVALRGLRRGEAAGLPGPGLRRPGRQLPAQLAQLLRHRQRPGAQVDVVPAQGRVAAAADAPPRAGRVPGEFQGEEPAAVPRLTQPQAPGSAALPGPCAAAAAPRVHRSPCRHLASSFAADHPGHDPRQAQPGMRVPEKQHGQETAWPGSAVPSAGG